MTNTWADDEAGVMQLPAGSRVRGRALRSPLPAGAVPDFGVYLLNREPEPVEWDSCWIRWPDFWLPTGSGQLRRVLTEALERSTEQRVELACGGGVGRTGTALACLAALDGHLSGRQAVAYVRSHYRPSAVETPWQRWFVGRFASGSRPAPG